MKQWTKEKILNLLTDKLKGKETNNYSWTFGHDVYEVMEEVFKDCGKNMKDYSYHKGYGQAITIFYKGYNLFYIEFKRSKLKSEYWGYREHYTYGYKSFEIGNFHFNDGSDCETLEERLEEIEKLSIERQAQLEKNYEKAKEAYNLLKRHFNLDDKGVRALIEKLDKEKYSLEKN